MSSSRAHSLLSELHRLLATYKESDFWEAADLSPRFRESLVELGRNATKEVLKEGLLTIPRSQSRGNHITDSHRSAVTDEVFTLLKESVYGDSIAAIHEFAERVGVHIPISSKESKDRITRRFASAVASLAREERQRIIREISQGSQTEGWVDLLKRHS